VNGYEFFNMLFHLIQVIDGENAGLVKLASVTTIHVHQYFPLQKKPSINDIKINYWTISIVRAIMYGYLLIPPYPA